MHRSTPLRAATALVTTLALVLPPMPAAAQDADALAAQCAEGGVPEDLLEACVTAFAAGEDGVAAALTGEAAEADGDGDGDGTEAMEEAADAAVDTTADATADAGADDAVMDATGGEALAQEAVDDATAEAAATAEGADVLVEEATPDAAVEGATAEAAGAQPETGDGAVVETQGAEGQDGAEALQEDAEAAPATEQETAQDVVDAVTEELEAEVAPQVEAVEPDATAEADASADGAAAVEAPVADAAETDPLAEALEAEAAETPAVEPVTEGGVTEEVVVEDAPVTADPVVEAPAAPETAEAPEAAPAPTVPESAVAAEVAARPEPELTPEQEVARDQAQAALEALGAQTGQTEGAAPAPAPAAAAAPEADAQAEVVERTVEEAEVRASSEDFATRAVVTDDDDGGLSDTQKLALGALGALAVGTLLANQTRVVSNSGDRVVVQRADGDLTVLKDDDALLRQAGSTVREERFADGSTRTTVTRPDGSRIVTIRDASLRVLRRTLIEADGTEYTLIDDTAEVERVDVAALPSVPVVSTRTGDALGDALAAQNRVDRRFSLAQVRTIPQVRALAPAIEVESVTFESGSAAIQPDQAPALTEVAREMVDAIRADPREVFLIEGHTDAVGDAAYNLALSDRRAESLALALNEYFQVPVENMVVQGYGERFLKVQTQGDERANRRAVARRITGLLQTAAAN